jgi:hypothetical protein
MATKKLFFTTPGQESVAVNVIDDRLAVDTTVTVAADIQLGAMELKDGDSDARGNVKAANTARTVATTVLAVQHVDAVGNPAIFPGTLAANGGLKVEGVAGGVAQPISNAAQECATVAEYNVALAVINTEYAQALPANARKVIFRCRTADAVRYAWVTGKVATPVAPYQTLKANADYSVEGIKVASSTLYFASALAGVVMEVEVWS